VNVPPNQLPDFTNLTPEETAALQALARGNEWLRAVLCTLARRGVAYRQADAQRAQAILSILSPFPYYKAGQFLFDLMEWEDFMLDGPPPPILDTVMDWRSIQKLDAWLQELQSYLDGNVPAPTLPGVPDQSQGSSENLPPLEPGYYLYQDVVLGLVHSVLTAREAPALSRPMPGPAAGIRLTLDPPVIDVTPGQQDAMQVTLVNETRQPDEFELRVDGLPAGWATLATDSVSLAAGRQVTFLLVFSPPRTSITEARRYPFEVVATGRQSGASATASGVIIVQPFTALFVDMRPIR
jgi:hypothetical protein